MRTTYKGQQLPTHPAAVRERHEQMVQAVGARSRFVTRPSGRRVHVIESGDGPPVVQLHGNNTSSLSHLMLLEELPGVRSYLVDRPGFGLSEPDDFPRARFRQDIVGFLDEVLDALEVGPTVLLGASGGGVVATWFSLDRPERVRGLVMLGSVPLLPGARIPLGLRLMATPGVGNVLRRAMRPDRRVMLRLLTTMGEGDTIMRHPDLLDSLVDAARDPIAQDANAAELRAFLSLLGVRPGTRIRPEELRRITRPTLMIWGDHDPVVSVEAARSVALLIPDARLELLPAGHVPQLGHPRRVAEHVVEFAHDMGRSFGLP
jgi:pimeloyl-ACP methyl ester carboxylesterase